MNHPVGPQPHVDAVAVRLHDVAELAARDPVAKRDDVGMEAPAVGDHQLRSGAA